MLSVLVGSVLVLLLTSESHAPHRIPEWPRTSCMLRQTGSHHAAPAPQPSGWLDDDKSPSQPRSHSDLVPLTDSFLHFITSLSPSACLSFFFFFQSCHAAVLRGFFSH